MAKRASLVLTVKPSWTSYFFVFPLLFPPRLEIDGHLSPRALWHRPIRTDVGPGPHRISTGIGIDTARVVVEAQPGEDIQVTYVTPRSKLGRGRFHVVQGAELERDDDEL